MREVYRILDANFNRAREALRVVEDFARFALDDAAIAGTAKAMRSRLQEINQQFPADALLASRDTPGDVGTVLTSPTEGVRPDAQAVATAACKRLTEALRTLEEYAKVVAADPLSLEGRGQGEGVTSAQKQVLPPPSPSPGSPAASHPLPSRERGGRAALASELEALRYQSYTLEQRLGQRLGAARRFAGVRLYVLLTAKLCAGDPLATAKAAIAGGADCIQLREKDASARKILDLAGPLREMTRQAGVLFIMNDRADLAAAAGADGVHLGQDDLPVAAARRLLPPGALVGKSTHTIAQARAAVEEGADYIGVGPMFPTGTKDAGPLAGPEYLRQVVAEITLPHVAIGGVTAANVSQLVAAGARRVAVCSAVIAAADPAAAAAAIKRQLPD